MIDRSIRRRDSSQRLELVELAAEKREERKCRWMKERTYTISISDQGGRPTFVRVSQNKTSSFLLTKSSQLCSQAGRQPNFSSFCKFASKVGRSNSKSTICCCCCCYCCSNVLSNFVNFSSAANDIEATEVKRRENVVVVAVWAGQGRAVGTLTLKLNLHHETALFTRTLFHATFRHGIHTLGRVTFSPSFLVLPSLFRAFLASPSFAFFSQQLRWPALSSQLSSHLTCSIFSSAQLSSARLAS